LWILCLGCQATPPVTPVLEAAQENTAGKELWEKGQAAMRAGQSDEAIACYQQSLAAAPHLLRNHLSLAAAYLEKGAPAEACPHLAKYLEAHPRQLLIRVQYAELLWRLHQLQEARTEFERYVAGAQDKGETLAGKLIHCHTRLMEIAEEEENAYEQHLNRGIGLYLLARKRAALPDPEGELSTEGLLCKAAGELMLARLQRPDEARPCWYLHQVWSQLDQPQPARHWLRAADAAAAFSYLTPAEQSSLYLACRRCETVARK
jgi:tetratricopeptide (TPR) repeat protein